MFNSVVFCNGILAADREAAGNAKSLNYIYRSPMHEKEVLGVCIARYSDLTKPPIQYHLASSLCAPHQNWKMEKEQGLDKTISSFSSITAKFKNSSLESDEQKV